MNNKDIEQLVILSEEIKNKSQILEMARRVIKVLGEEASIQCAKYILEALERKEADNALSQGEHFGRF